MKKIAILIASCLIIFTSCNKEESPKPKRMVLAYVFGNVDLWFLLQESINQMEEGIIGDEDGTMLVYLDWSPGFKEFQSPVLLEISHDKTSAITSRVIKTYPKDQDPSDPVFFESVLRESIKLYPADSYGLIIAGHSDGWVPNNDLTKSIGGADRLGNKYLDIDELAAALPVKYEFIIFHACLMAESASLYQFRGKTDNIIASVESFPGNGYPYHLATKYLFTQPYANLSSFVNETERYYTNDVKKEDFAYGTFGLYKMDKMEPLAAAVKKSINSLPLTYDNLRKECHAITDNNGDAMLYPFPKITIEKRFLCYDYQLFIDILKNHSLYNEAEELSDAIDAFVSCSSVVIGSIGLESVPFLEYYKKYAKRLSFYIPNAQKNEKEDKIFYNRFDWAKSSGFTPDRAN